MANLKRMFLILIVTAFVSGSVMFSGCGGGISDEQKEELAKLQNEVASLEKDVDAKKAEKSRLESDLKKKEDDLKKKQDDINKIKNCK